MVAPVGLFLEERGSDIAVWADVCFNCLDESRSHYKLHCPFPSRCGWTMREDGACHKRDCTFHHPQAPSAPVSLAFGDAMALPHLDFIGFGAM